jgi:hypothetical protein
MDRGHVPESGSGGFGFTMNDKENRILELQLQNSRLQCLVAELLIKNQHLRDAHPAHIEASTSSHWNL